MRIIKSAEEAEEILLCLPDVLRKEHPSWQEVYDSAFRFKSDIIYSDISNFWNMRFVPQILQAIGQERCFVFNHRSLLARKAIDGCEIAFEIFAADGSEQIEALLRNQSSNRDQFLSVFHLVGDCGFVTPQADWFIFARVDSLALFSCDDEITYSDFQRAWWCSVHRQG